MGHFAVLGLGAFGYSAAVALASEGHQVLAMDVNRDRVHEIKDNVAQAVVVDATDRDALRALGLKDMDAVILAMSEERLDTSILTTLYLKELGVERIIAKAANADQAKVLTKVGASETVQPERDMAMKLAHTLGSPNLFDRLVLTEDLEIVELLAPEGLLNQPLRELHLRLRYNAQVLLIKRGYLDAPATTEEHHHRKYRVKFPTADDTLQQGDIMVLMGQKDGLKKLQEQG